MLRCIWDSLDLSRLFGSKWDAADVAVVPRSAFLSASIHQWISFLPDRLLFSSTRHLKQLPSTLTTTTSSAPIYSVLVQSCHSPTVTINILGQNSQTWYFRSVTPTTSSQPTLCYGPVPVVAVAIAVGRITVISHHRQICCVSIHSIHLDPTQPRKSTFV